MHQCRFVDWYKFETQCTITTCKFHSTQVKSCCMGIARRAPGGNKTISDQEICHYKFDGKLTTRGVSIRRKKAMKRVKTLVAFHRLVDKIRDTYEPTLSYTGGDETIDTALKSYPFKFKRIRFENWMLLYLFDAVVYKHFLDQTGHRGESAEMTLQDMLDMPRRDYLKLETCVRNLAR